MNCTNDSKSMSLQQDCVLFLCPLPSLRLDEHVEGLQGSVGRLSVQDGLGDEHCTAWGCQNKNDDKKKKVCQLCLEQRNKRQVTSH